MYSFGKCVSVVGVKLDPLAPLSFEEIVGLNTVVDGFLVA